MSIQNKDTLKGYFQTGDKPTQSQFGDLIDTLGASFSLYNSTISSDNNTDIVLRGSTNSVSYWASLIGQIPNLDDDYAGSSIATDGSNIYIIGGNTSDSQALIIKLDANGNVIWQKEVVENSFGECIIFNNNYLWLFYSDYGDDGGISIIQMDTTGNEIGNWNFTTDVYTAFGYEIDVDENNNVYFVGYQNNGTAQQICIGKLNTTTSNIDWVFNMGDVNGEEGLGIKYSNGFVYTTGYASNGFSNIAVINKMDTNGNLIWSKSSNIAASALTITVDTTGNVYVGGTDDNTNGLLFALDSNGNKLYCKKINVSRA